MEKGTKVVFKKYGQHYEGTIHSVEAHRVKVTSLSGGLHLIDKNDVQTEEQYKASIKVATVE